MPTCGSPEEPREELREEAAFGRVYNCFYRTARMGCIGLSDAGGPFGFDICVAVQVHNLVLAYGCDALVETGCYLGDTTDYLSAAYPDLPVVSCDVVPEYARFTEHRLRDRHNVKVECRDSAEVVAAATRDFERPFLYLDAHWYGRWPLLDEIRAARRGVVCIDDFDVGHPRFAYDSYDGVECGPRLLGLVRERVPRYYVGDPAASYPFPCLQVGRRSGQCFFPVELSREPFELSPFFLARELPEGHPGAATPPGARA